MWLVGIAGTALAVAGGAIYTWRSAPDASSRQHEVAPAKSSPETPPAAAATAAAPSAPVAELQTADRKPVNEQQLVDMLLGKNGTTNPSGNAVKPFDPVDVLQDIYRQRDHGHVVTVVPEKAKVRIGQDKLRFRITSLKPGYVYILMVGTDNNHFKPAVSERPWMPTTGSLATAT
jgi:hypothetical protein